MIVIDHAALHGIAERIFTAAKASSNWVQGKVAICGKTRRQARSE